MLYEGNSAEIYNQIERLRPAEIIAPENLISELQSQNQI